MLLKSFILMLAFAQLAKGGVEQKRLLQKIFQNYNKLERPVINEQDKLDVFLGLTLQQIVNINEKMQNMMFSGWLDMYWKDYNLVWQPEEFGNITKIRVHVDNIWTPDVLLYNSADDSFDSTTKVNAVIEYTGDVSYIPPGMFKSTCIFKIDEFPFDRQVCSLKFGSWTYDEAYINLTNRSDRGQNGSYIKNAEWILEDILSYSESISYECCPDKYPFVMFDVHIRRRTLYYESNLIFPCIFISCLTLLGFLLPPDSGEKIGLEVTILLVIITFSQVISHSIPASSLSVSRIGLYFMSIMLISSFSILANILVLIVHHRNVKINKCMPKWFEVLVCEYLASILRMQYPFKHHNQNFHRKPIRKKRSVYYLNEANEANHVGFSNLPSIVNNPKLSNTNRIISYEKFKLEQVKLYDQNNNHIHHHADHHNHLYNNKLTIDLINANISSKRKKSGDNLLPDNLTDVFDIEDTNKMEQTQIDDTQSLYDNNTSTTTSGGGVCGSGSSDKLIFTYFKNDIGTIKNSLQGMHKQVICIAKRVKETSENEINQLKCKFAALVLDRLCMYVFTILLLVSASIIFSTENFLKDSNPSVRF